MLNSIQAFVSSKFIGLSLHDKIYKLGAYAFGAYLAIAFAFGLFLGPNYINQIASIFFYFIATIFTCAVFVEYWFALKPVLEKTWVKWVGAGIAYLVFRYSEGKAEDFVNGFTGIDPSALSSAVSLLTALFLPYSWVVLIAAILGVYVIFIWFFAPVQISNDEKNLGGWKFLGRIIGLFTIFVILQQLITAFDKEDSIAVLIAKETTLRTEYFKEFSCKGIAKGSLVADIGRGYISVFTPNSMLFEVKKCEYDITRP